MPIGKLTPLYFRQELMTVHVTFLPSRSAQRLSSNEISFDSGSNVVVASTTATGRDLCTKIIKKNCDFIHYQNPSLSYLKTIALFASYAPTTKSGYMLPSKSIPPDNEKPNVLRNPVPTMSSAKITCDGFSNGPSFDP